MVKNKNIGGRPHRPSTCKTKKAGSQITNTKDLTSLDDPPVGDVPAAPPELQTSSQDELGFPDRVYLLASVIFQNNHLEKLAAHRLVNYGKERGLPLPEVKDEMQRKAYELAFNTLKYQELLEDIMIDSCFYLTQPMPDDQMSLVAVMLYDFQDRKFLPREHQGEEFIQEVRNVENYLLSLDEVQRVLKSVGISQVKSIGQLEGQTFCQDPHCGDILVFPARLKAVLHSTKLLSDHKLIIQDKSCSVGPNSVRSLLPGDGDVLMVGCFSGLTVSHTASIIAKKHKANSNGRSTVYVCVSDRTDAQREELQRVVTLMGCKNVKLISKVFQSLDSGDKQLENVRVILLNPKCSVSAISNPVEFILQENGVPKVLAVVYSTCSSYPEENEEVVSRAMEQANGGSEQEGEPKKAKVRLRPSPFSSPDHAEGPKEMDSFFMLKPSEQSNGCFLAVLMREPEPVVKEPPQEVLARANAKGILDNITSNQRTRKEQHGQTNRLTKATHARTSQHLSVSIRSKSQDSRGSNSSALCGHQQFANRRQSPQGKTKTLHLQPSKNSVSSSFSSKQENNTAMKTSALRSAPPPANPVAPAVRGRRAHQEVLRPVVLVLPPVHFPNFFPPKHSRAGFIPNLSYNKWRPPAQTGPVSRSSGRLSNNTMLKSWPLF
ncbi:hypothetical protein PAMP_023690 [Pampus punctatissimus]